MATVDYIETARRYKAAQYGKPSEIDEALATMEPDSWPYQVYQYYKKNPKDYQLVSTFTTGKGMAMLEEVRLGRGTKSERQAVKDFFAIVKRLPLTPIEFTVWRGVTRAMNRVGDQEHRHLPFSGTFTLSVSKKYQTGNTPLYRITIPKNSNVLYHHFMDQVMFPGGTLTVTSSMSAERVVSIGWSSY
jgi:hypothetical protein